MTKPKTIEELRAAIEAGKRAAQQRLDAFAGHGTYAKIERYSKSDANRRALENICAANERFARTGR